MFFFFRFPFFPPHFATQRIIVQFSFGIFLFAIFFGYLRERDRESERPKQRQQKNNEAKSHLSLVLAQYNKKYFTVIRNK